jgi:hypothetical protein
MLSAFQSGCAPVSDPSAGMSVAEAVKLIDHAPLSGLKPEAVAEAFALNSRFTDVQRDMLQSQLVGHSIEWELQVYEVESDDGRYKVTSQAIPVKDPDAVPLLRVVAFVLPQNKAHDSSSGVGARVRLRARGSRQRILRRLPLR